MSSLARYRRWLRRGLPYLPRLGSLLLARLPTRSRLGLARRLVARANTERDARRYQVAAPLYEEALRLDPGNPRLMVQHGHMLKEAGDLAGAERAYLAAADRLRGDPDIALQLGHFYKVAGRFDEAAAAYREAIVLRPGWAEAEGELAQVSASARWGDVADHGPAEEDIVPELLPGEGLSAGVLREGIHMRRLGATRVRVRGAFRRALCGVEAIHGFVISTWRVSDLVIRMDGDIIIEAALHPCDTQAEQGGQTKYVFNLWHDFSGVEAGVKQIELTARRSGVPDLVYRAILDVAPPISAAEQPGSDAIVDPPGPHEGGLDEAVDRRPSMIRPAPRRLIKDVQTILVQRADQLGDMVCSVPALVRLRELFPEARLVALVTPSNADLARTLPMLDEVVVAEFPEGPDGRRTMGVAAQKALRRRLAAYRFDVALDLAETSASRPLLLLSGAPFLFGFKDRESPWLTAGFELNAHDPGNYHEMNATAHKLVALVDALGEMALREPCILRRDNLDRARIAGLGGDTGRRYAVLHTGARLPYTRWPGFAGLAERLLAQTDLDIVAMGEEATQVAPSGDRVRYVSGTLSFDDFDVLLSHCALFVGNDSGPKHLAALRGAPVVSLHMARLNWNEWGQEASGLIVSRRVPCAGCGIGHNAEDCGKDFACLRRITPEEVFEAAMRLIGP